MYWIAVFIGGGFGSLSRYGISYLFKLYKFQKVLPLATILTNLLACIILAILFYLLKDKINHSSWLYALLGIGFCGGFSTFSTFSLESLQLIQEKMYFYAALNILVSIISCLLLMLYIAKQQG